MDKVTVTAPAKLNLSLDVTGTDGRGYHTLDMIMQTVSVYEKVTVMPRQEGIVLSSNAKYIPRDSKNVAFRAAEVFFDHSGISAGADIYIRKKVPIKAGMAGGSADAAGVLVALDRLYGTVYGTEKLMELGGRVGSDVPFMISGGTKRVQGTGDVILPCPAMPRCHLVICMPSRGVSTPAAFMNFDRLGKEVPVDTRALMDAMARKDIRKAALFMVNELEEAARSPDTRPIKEKLLATGALGAAMTGSGAAVFGVFDDDSLAQKAVEALKEDYRSVYLAHPVSFGARVDRPLRKG